jgi:undecaprenyl-diphosphatase
MKTFDRRFFRFWAGLLSSMANSLIEKPKSSFNGEAMNRLSLPRLAAATLLLAVVAWLGWTGGPGNAFDRAAILRLAAAREAHPNLGAAAIALTWLGSAYVTLGGAALVAAWRFSLNDRAAAIWAFATIALGRLLAEVIKLAVDRPRPHFTPWPVPVSSLSFPSGHATNSMLGFGMIALLLAPVRYRRAASAAAIVLALAIGITRPFLGVHWPSDVLAGWMLGGAMLVIAAPFRPNASRTAA